MNALETLLIALVFALAILVLVVLGALVLPCREGFVRATEGIGCVRVEP